jgi:uncharacterized membrane protein
MKNIKWEKVGIYVACLSFLLTFWMGQNQIQRDITNIRERLAKIEVKVEKLEEKK